MSIFRTNTTIFRTDIYTTTTDINIRTEGDDLKINLNENYVLSNGDVRFKNIYLLDENDGSTYKKLYNDDTSLFWGDKSVLVDDDNINVSDITFSGNLKIGDTTFQFPSTLGNEGNTLKTHADGSLFWGSAVGGLATLDDTDIQLPEDNQLLKYSISAEKWINTSAISNITINDSIIGQTVPASGKFTNLQSLVLHIDNDASINGNINLDGNLNIVGSVRDENENDLITFISTPDAVNNIKITNNITGENPIISTAGDDNNIDLSFQSKGNASYNFLSTTDTATTINLYENASNGNHKLSLKVPESLTTNIVFTFPNNTGVNGQVLTTDGNGDMSWSPSLTISNEGINRLITSDGAGGIEAESSLTFDGTDLNVYKATNDGNPTVNIGSSFAESLSIQSVYSSGDQSLDYVSFNTRTNQPDADKGTMIFSIDDTSIFSVIDQGINLVSGKKLYIDSEEILSNYAGATTLKNINSIDSITNITIKGGIDELGNLTSAPILETIGTIITGKWNADIVDVSYGGTGATTLPQYRILIGDDSDPVTTSDSLTFDGNVLNIQADIQLNGNINDQNNNELLEFFNDPDAVNHLAILNAPSGNNPVFSVAGDSNDIGIDFRVKNNGTYNFKATDDAATIINLYNNENNGNNAVSLTVPNIITNSYSLTLPENTGTSGQVLTTDGSGVTSWINKPTLTNDSTHSIIVADGNGDLEGTNLTYNNSELKLYKTVNDGNPSFSVGSSDNELVVIQPIYDAGAQTLDKVIINTKTQSTDPDKGKIELRVDDELIITIDDNGMIMKEEGTFKIGDDIVLNELSGDITLSNIAVIDVMTQSTIQNTITSLPSVSTVGTITSGTWNGSIVDVTYGGTGTSTFDTNELLIGNGASQIITSDNLTFNGSVLGVNADINLSGSIKDYLFNNELLRFSSSGASAVNEITISNNTTGNNPIISASGNDSNIGLDFQVKGTGKYNFKGTSTTSAELVLFENATNGSNTITIKTPADITSSYSLTLPDTDGDVNQVLKTDGVGNLSWVDQGSLNITNPGNNRITTSDGTSGLIGEANLLFDGISLSQYIVANDGNPTYSLGASSDESLVIQSVYDTGAQTLDKVMFTTKAASASTDKGKFEFYVDEALISTFNDSGMMIKTSGTLAFGSSTILSDSSGTTTLSNIDAIDATTEATLEAAIDTLSNLTSIGTITSGTWQAGVIGVSYGGTGQTSLTSNSILTGNGTSGIVAEANLTFDGSLLYVNGDMQLSGDILGSTGDIGLAFSNVGGTSYFKLISDNGADSPIISVDGVNANIDVILEAKGSGSFKLYSNNTTSAELHLFHNLTNGLSSVSFKAPDNLTSGSYSLTLPIDAGNAAQVLSTDGNGVLSWVDSGSSIVIDNDGNNRIITATGAGGLNGEANLLFDGITLSQYIATNDGNPTYSLGASSDETLTVQSVYDTGAQTLDKVMFTTKAASNSADKGKFEFYVDEVLVSSLVDSGITIKTSGSLAFGSSTILSDSSGTTTLSNIDAIDATTTSTLEAAIDTLSNLTTIGTITSGTWNGTAITVPYGGTGQSSLTSDSILTGNGTSGVVAESTLKYSGTDLTQYVSSNDGNPTYSIGASSSETLIVQSVYDSGAQTLDKVMFTTKAASASVDKGKFEFYVDEALISTFNDAGMMIKTSGTLAFGSSTILSDSSGTTTLSNIDAIDATTEATIEAAIDTLSNLTSIGTITSGTWNGTVISPTYGGTGVPSLSSITSLSGLDTVGTITTGTWNGTTISVPYGGTGTSSFTTGGLLIGNNTSAVSTSSDLTYSSSILNLAASSKIAIGTINIIDDTSGTTTLSNIDAIDAITEATLEAAIDTLSNLTTIGTITSGTWNGTVISPIYGGTGQSSLTSDSILTGNGTSGVVAESTLKYSGTDLTQYVSSNDGNPTYSIGASSDETLTVQSVYDTGAQTLDKVMFTTKAASASTDKGKFEFYVDEALISTFNDAGLMLKTSGTLAFGSSTILSDSSGTTTLSNIDAIDATTEATIEAAIDTLSNLTSIGTITSGTWNGTVISPIYGGTGASSFTSGGLLIGNNTSAVSASSNLTYSSSILNLAASSKIAIGSINIIDDTSGTTTLSNIDAIDATTEATLEAAIDTLSNLTTIGTITSGTWNGTVISPTYGGTGQSSLTADSILTGNGTSGIVAESNLTFNGSVLGVTGDIRLSGSILDTNSNELLKFATIGSAVNEVTISNNVTGQAPIISATGNDTNIALQLKSKGTGLIQHYVNSNIIQEIGASYVKNYNELRLTNGSNNISFSTPVSIPSSYNAILPSTAGLVGQTMIVSGVAGSDLTMSFGTPTYGYSTISTNTNAAVNIVYLCNTSAGSFTVTLPSAPTVGSVISLIDSTSSFSTYNLVVSRGGSDVLYVNTETASATSIAVSTNNTKITCEYVASGRWTISYPYTHGIKVALLRDEKTKNTSGGSSTAGAWNTRTINTEYDPDNIVSISSNLFTLLPGKYLIESYTSGFRTDRHKAALYTSTGTLVQMGSSEYCGNGDFAETASRIFVILNISTSTSYTIKQYTLLGANPLNLGVESNCNDANGVAAVEVYSDIKITKYDEPIITNVSSLLNYYNRNTISTTTNPLVVNTIYSCNTSVGAFTVTLPSSPAQGDYIELIDANGTFGTNNLTITTGGSHQMYVNTNTVGATSLVITANNAKIKCTYANTNRWCIEYQNTFGVKIALLRDEQPKTTYGGTSTAGAWNTRVINTKYDPDGIVSISSNLFTLLPGKYLIEAYTSGFAADRHKAALYTSGGTLIQMGSSEYSGNGNYASTSSRILAILNISTSTIYTVKHFTTYSNVRVLGVESNCNDANGVAAVEVYTDIKITKYDEPIITNVSSLLNYYNRNTISTTTNPLVVNTIYSCDTSGGAFTVTLPSSPAQGDYIELIDANGTFNTNNLTIAAAGSYIFANSSTTGTASLVIGITNCKIKCTYTNTNRWCLEYINATGIKYAIVRDEKVKNTDGGTNASTPFWNTRTINTEYDPHNIVTLTGGTTGVGGTANAFILEPGNYLINVKTLVEQIRYYRVELFDVTSNTPVTNGINNFTSASNDVSGVGLLDYILHISTTTTYSIKLYASQVASNYGLGSKLNINTSAGTNTPANYEVYTILQITKYDDPITSGVVSVLNTYNRNTISTTTNPLAVNTIYSCNTNGGAFTVTLPSSAPAQGDYIELIDANGTFGTNNLTINTGGSHQMYVNTNTVGATSLVITANNAKIKCTYANTNRWCIEYQNAIGVKMAVLKEEQSQNVSGGTPTSGANSNIRVLNTKYDPDGIVTISSNVFTLQPGKYNIRASAPSASSNATKISLYSGTNATSPTYNVLEETGTSDFAISSGEMRSFLSSLQNLSTAKSFVIRHTVAAATATVGLGASTNINNINGVSQIEVYALVEIMKYDDPISTGVVSLMPSAYTNKLAITGSLTLAVNTYYYITSSGTYTLTLPASPSLGDMIEITDGTGALASNVATVTRAGSQNILIGDVSVTSFAMNRNGMKCKLEYINTNRWAMTTTTNEGIWQTYTLTWGAVTTPPTMPTTVLKNVASYTVVGKMLYIHYDYYHSSAAGAAAGSGSYLFPLPPGYTMAASITASDTLTSSLNRFALGSGYVLSTNTSSTTILQCIAYNSTKIILLWTSGTSSSYIGSSSVPMTASPYSLSFNACIPLD